MEKTLVLQAETRQRVGTREAGRLRDVGRIPAVVYGHKQTPKAVSLDRHEFMLGLHHGHRLIDVSVDGSAESMIVKDVQYDFLGKQIIHVDFMRVDASERVKVAVPLELKGTAKGTHEGGMIEEHADHLQIEAVVSVLPEVLMVNLKDVGVGDVVYARDVDLPEGIKLISPGETIVVTCQLKAAAKSAEEAEEGEEGAEGPSSPEVITEKKADEDAG